LSICQLHISLNRTAQIYLELHFCVELHTKKIPLGLVKTFAQCDGDAIVLMRHRKYDVSCRLIFNKL